MKNLITPSYTFTPGGSGVGTLQLNNFAEFDIKLIYAVINITRDDIIFAPAIIGKGFTSYDDTTKTITLEYSTSSYNSGDVLQFIYESTSEYPSLVKQRPNPIWNVSFAEVGSSLLNTNFTQRALGTGVGVTQASSSLLVTAGTTANSEFLARSTRSWKAPISLRAKTILSQRIVNNNFAVLLADVIAEGASCTINSATSITVSVSGFGSETIGQSMFVGAINGANGVPGRYAIASRTASTITLTVAGWPASGSCTVDLFGYNYVYNRYTTSTATSSVFDSQRKGWNSGDTTLTINTTASPGHVIQLNHEVRSVAVSDFTVASVATLGVTSRGSRVENIPDDTVDLHVFLWSYNGTTNPASSTTWTCGLVSIEDLPNNTVYIGGARSQGTANGIAIVPSGTQTVSFTQPALVASTARIGSVGSSGIWYDDSSTTMTANQSFTGTSRDITVTASATGWANAGTFGQELVVSAESDVAGTLWLEVSRDNTNWRRVKSISTSAITGGGQYAEIVHRPSWRYARVGYTNGATGQARFTIGSFLKAT